MSRPVTCLFLGFHLCLASPPSPAGSDASLSFFSASWLSWWLWSRGSRAFLSYTKTLCTTLDHLAFTSHPCKPSFNSLFLVYLGEKPSGGGLEFPNLCPGQRTFLRAREPDLLGDPWLLASSFFQGMEVFAFLVAGPLHKNIRGIVVWASCWLPTQYTAVVLRARERCQGPCVLQGRPCGVVSKHGHSILALQIYQFATRACFLSALSLVSLSIK